MPETSPLIVIVAGEASGDLHGSNLVKALRRLDPSLRFSGIGGKKLQEAGVELIANSSEMGVVGLTEVLFRLGTILKAYFRVKQMLRENKPALLILIDYPDFNLRMARIAKSFGVKVFYYIGPQVWAWRKGRVKQLKSTVEKMAVILPFEPDFYRRSGMEAVFVGHPLLDEVKIKYTRGEACRKFGLREDAVTVAILPGSRESEARRMLPEIKRAAEILAEKFKGIQFILPLASTLDESFIRKLLKGARADIRIAREDAYDAIALADAALVTSGTATVETGLLGVPMVIVYKVSCLSYYVGKCVIDVDRIGMVNIIAGKSVVPELIQSEATPERMAGEISRILLEPEIRAHMKSSLLQTREKLGGPGAAGRAASLAYELIRSGSE